MEHMVRTLTDHKAKRKLISGTMTVFVLLVALILTAVIFPRFFTLPRLIEAEIVIASWLVIWWITLSTLLFKGWSVDDDQSPKFKSDSARWKDIFDLSGGDGLGGLLMSIVLSIVFVVLVNLLIDLLIPAFVYLVYIVVLKMLRTAANDRHNIEGKLGMAMIYGVWWSMLYSLPLFTLVWGLRYFRLVTL